MHENLGVHLVEHCSEIQLVICLTCVLGVVQSVRMANKVSDQIKLSFDKAKDQAVSFSEEDKLGYAGTPNIETPQTSTPAFSGEQKPVTFPNVKTSDPFQFPPPPFYGKGDQFGGTKFKTFSGFPPQSNVGSYKPNQESNTSHFYEVTHAQVPRIPQFSGDDPPQKGDVTYREWRYEVQCLMNDPEIKETTIIQSIRRSLRGTAKTMLIPLGEKARVREILDKLNILFGEVSNNGMIMQEFFNAYQFPGECATSFGCRLESMLQNAIESGYLNKSSKNDLLRHKFWTSLSSERLKSQTRHKYDTLTNYDHLLLEIRRVEKEISINKNPDKVSKSTESRGQRLHQHGISVENDVEERINTRIQNLQSELEGKIDEKFNQILKRLDAPRDDFRQNYSGGRKGRWNGKSERGEYKKYYSKNKSNSKGQNKSEQKQNPNL